VEHRIAETVIEPRRGFARLIHPRVDPGGRRHRLDPHLAV
jgi:hypothetical protein